MFPCSWDWRDSALEDIMLLNLCSGLNARGSGHVSLGTILPVSYLQKKFLESTWISRSVWSCMLITLC